MNSPDSGSGCLRLSRLVLLALVAGGVGWLLWREAPRENRASYGVEAEGEPDWRTKSRMPPAEGARCVDCHAEIVAMWEGSQHARANRLIADADLSPGTVEFGGVSTRISESEEGLSLFQKGLDGFRFEGSPVAVIGVDPLVQPLVVTSNGQWQVFNPAYRRDTKEWFNAFPDVRQPGDWGHWSKRGMNWNAQCAWCHMTDFNKNHDPDTDTYDSTWEAMGISCAQCHGDLSAHAANPEAAPGRRFVRVAAQDNCMSCHARREFLTPGGFKAGGAFHEHFRLALFDQPGVYYPDGQVRDENFEAGSFLSSKMHDAGVTCFDCHNPHSGGLTAPVENNALCMSCHAPPGARGATPILPETHSHHAAGSTGNRCVECHMPETEYMQSDWRRDHGFTVPDPMLTRVRGVPNACNRCHQDQTVEWAERFSEEWYGDKLAARRTRPRASAIHEAWEGIETAGEALARLAKEETNAVWKASLLSLMRPYVRERGVRELLQTSLRHENGLVRSAAVRSLSPYPQFQNLLVNLRHDPNRMVRLDAAWATLERGGLNPDLEEDLRGWLRFNADQPAGALHLAEAGLREEKPEEAVRWAERLLTYDDSAEPNLMAGRIFHAAGDLEKASASLERVVELNPEHVEGWFVLAMFRGERGDLEGAMDAFRRAVLLEPGHGRAWYNLGLAHIQGGNREAGLAALARAEDASPNSADPAYAAATAHARAGDTDLAVEALERALEREPGHAPSRRLLMRLR